MSERNEHGYCAECGAPRELVEELATGKLVRCTHCGRRYLTAKVSA